MIQETYQHNKRSIRRLERAIAKVIGEHREDRNRRLGGILDALEALPGIALQEGMEVEEKEVFYKIRGSCRDRAINVYKTGRNIELLGFDMEGNRKAFKEVSKEEVKRRHLGRIKARMILRGKNKKEILIAFKQALQELNRI